MPQFAFNHKEKRIARCCEVAYRYRSEILQESDAQVCGSIEFGADSVKQGLTHTGFIDRCTGKVVGNHFSKNAFGHPQFYVSVSVAIPCKKQGGSSARQIVGVINTCIGQSGYLYFRCGISITAPQTVILDKVSHIANSGNLGRTSDLNIIIISYFFCPNSASGIINLEEIRSGLEPAQVYDALSGYQQASFLSIQVCHNTCLLTGAHQQASGIIIVDHRPLQGDSICTRILETNRHPGFSLA